MSGESEIDRIRPLITGARVVELDDKFNVVWIPWPA